MDPPRVVLDTHAWLDLYVFADPRVEPLARALDEGRVVAPMDPRMRDELLRVLAYPAFALGESRRDAIAAHVASRALAVPMPAARPGLPRCRDPDDRMFVEVAVAHGAAALLTRDGELLRLASRLRRLGTTVVTPADWCAASSRRAPAPP